MSDLNSHGLAEVFSFQCWIILQSFDLWFAQVHVGSEDFDMRVFKDDEMIAGMTGTEVGASTVFTRVKVELLCKSTPHFQVLG